MRRVNILGTEYEIVIDAPDEMLPPDSDGAMDHSIKRIVVAKFVPDERSIKDGVFSSAAIYISCSSKSCLSPLI